MKQRRRYGNCPHFPGEDGIDRLAKSAGVTKGRRSFHDRLTEGLERAVREGNTGMVCLRKRVFELTRGADAAGLSRDEVSAALVKFISEHPICDRLDRVCLTDGRHLSDRLVAQVERWVAAA